MKAEAGAGDVVVDDGDEGTHGEGRWSFSTGGDCHGVGAVYAKDNGHYLFAPRLAPGRYKIYLWWSGRGKLSTAVPVAVHGADGESVLTVNQRRDAGRWNLLGTFELDAAPVVKISVRSKAWVCADAVKFEPLTPPPEEPPVDLPPPPPAELTAAAGDGFVSLDWQDSTEPDLSGYRVYRSLSADSGYGLLAGDLPTSECTDSAVTNGETCYYLVTAFDTAGNESEPCGPVSATPVPPPPEEPPELPPPPEEPPADLPPPAPAELTAAPGDGLVILDWLDCREPDLSSYRIYRSFTPSCSYVLLARDVLTSDYSDTAVANGETYYYLVTAVDAAGNESEPGGPVSATPVAPPPEEPPELPPPPEEPPADLPPPAPAGLMAAPGDGFVSLDWSDITEPDLSGYLVYRSLDADAEYVLLAGDIQASDYTDAAVLNGTTYYYLVTATDTAGNESEPSGPVSATPVAPPPEEPPELPPPPEEPPELPPPPVMGSATLTWDAPTTNADGTPLVDLAGYRIYHGTTPGQYTDVFDVGDVTECTIDSLPPGTHYFVATAYNSMGSESDVSNEVSKLIE